MTDYIDEFQMGTQPNDGDRRLMVTFTLQARLDKAKSVEEGHNVYRDVEFITINVPGDRLSVVNRPVQPSDKLRFPQQYAIFKNARGEQIVGTPLSLWPGINPARVKELEYFNVRTVEQLATLADSGAGQMMGIQALKQAAKQFVEHSKSQAPLLKVQAELKERDDRLAAQDLVIKEQGEKLDKIIAGLAAQGEGAKQKGK